MNRIEKHLVPRRRVINLLRQAGHEVTPVPSQQGYDLLVNGHLRVALRVSYPRMRAHAVTSRGRRYLYRYRSWHFNFHHHGRVGQKYADIIVCIGLESHRNSDQAIFVIPWEALTGKTFSLMAGQRKYAGRYARYRDRWDLIGEASSHREAELQQVA